MDTNEYLMKTVRKIKKVVDACGRNEISEKDAMERIQTQLDLLAFGFSNDETSEELPPVN